MGIFDKLFGGQKAVSSPLIKAVMENNIRGAHDILVNCSDPKNKSEALFLALKKGYSEIANDLKQHGTKISPEQQKTYERKYQDPPPPAVQNSTNTSNQVTAGRVIVRETTIREIMVEAIKIDINQSVDLGGLNLIKQGTCGYMIDGNKIVRAFWVNKLQEAGSGGHLSATLRLHESTGELYDIPRDIFDSLERDKFFYAENSTFGDFGGFIILFEKNALPYCGRAR